MSSTGQKIWSMKINGVPQKEVMAVDISSVTYNGMGALYSLKSQKDVTVEIDLVKELKKVKCNNPRCQNKIWAHSYYKGFCRNCFYRISTLERNEELNRVIQGGKNDL